MSQVVCVECNATVPASQVDMTGKGWRCQKCGLRDQIDVHSGADDQLGQVSLIEMQERVDRAKHLGIVSVVVAVACVLLLASGAIEYEERRRNRSFHAALVAIPASLVFAGYEYMAWRRARTAVAIMKSRDPDAA